MRNNSLRLSRMVLPPGILLSTTVSSPTQLNVGRLWKISHYSRSTGWLP